VLDADPRRVKRVKIYRRKDRRELATPPRSAPPRSPPSRDEAARTNPNATPAP